MNNKKNLFTSITYVTGAKIAKTRKTIDIPRLSQTLEKHNDKQNNGWYTTLHNYVNNNETSHNLSIITVVRRVLRWHTPEQYNQEYSKYSNGLHNLRMRIGAGLDSDGMLGDNKNQRTKIDGIDGLKLNQTNKLSRDINDVHTVNKKSLYYVIDINTGNIISEIPDDVVYSLHSKNEKPKTTKIERDVEETINSKNISEEEKELLRQEYIKEKSELEKEYQGRNLLFDKILCICGSINHQSYYYINDLVINELSKDIKVNQQQLVEIAKKQLGESFDDIHGFEK